MVFRKAQLGKYGFCSYTHSIRYMGMVSAPSSPVTTTFLDGESYSPVSLCKNLSSSSCTFMMMMTYFVPYYPSSQWQANVHAQDPKPRGPLKPTYLATSSYTLHAAGAVIHLLPASRMGQANQAHQAPLSKADHPPSSALVVSIGMGHQPLT